MLYWFDPYRSITLTAIVLRVLLSAVSGGLIGLERSYKRRPAGFRTHILVCLAAGITTLTGQYLSLNLHYPTDMGRIGAQVIAGMGFIGAGTIIVTRRKSVVGLTTAAGLWATAIIGLSYGIGFYEGGLLGTILMLVAEVLFSIFEHKVLGRQQELNYKVTYVKSKALPDVLGFFRLHKVRVEEMLITRKRREETQKETTKEAQTVAQFILRLPPGYAKKTMEEALLQIQGVTQVQETDAGEDREEDLRNASAKGKGRRKKREPEGN